MAKTLRKRSKLRCLQQCLLVLLLGFSSLSLYAHSQDYLQVGVYKERLRAEQFIASIEKYSSYSAAIWLDESGDHKQYLVVIEGFKNKTDAKRFQSVLKSHYVDSELKRQNKTAHLYRFSPTPLIEEAEVRTSYQDLYQAIEDPQYLLSNTVHLPTSPDIDNEKPFYLSMRDAIFLSLRYNSQLQSTELDRIVQRYQLRIAENKFELQYALTGSGTKNWFTSKESDRNESGSLRVTPEISLNSAIGTHTSLEMENYTNGNNYDPTLRLKITQPLLRGFGATVNEQTLRDQRDTEISNKLNLKQSIINQITGVISAYRALIQQNNNLITQKKSLKDAEQTFWVNKKRIEAGALEPKGNIQQAFQISSIKTNLESQENALVIASQTLLTAIGLDPNMQVTVPSNVSIETLEIPNLEKSTQYALSHNTEYLQALISYRKNQRAYQVAQNQQLWKLDLEASTESGTGKGIRNRRGFNDLFDKRRNNQHIGVSFSVPINDLSRRSELISAKVTLEKSRLGLLALKRKLITNIINNTNNIRTQVHLYNMTVKQVELAEESYDVEVKKQEAGIATSIDVTTSQNQLINARNSLISVKISYLNQMSTLEQILGTTLDAWKIHVRLL